MKQIHFTKEIYGKIIWASCSMNDLQGGPFEQQYTDDPDKVTCRACRRTRIWKEKKITKLEANP